MVLCLTYGNVEVYWRAHYVDYVLTSPCVYVHVFFTCTFRVYQTHRLWKGVEYRNENRNENLIPRMGDG
jgi:hypothetical protein